MLKKKLVRIFRSAGIEINIVFSSYKVRQYFSLKDKSDRCLKSSLVYKFQCSGDPNQAYIGKTKRYLRKRITEHQKSGSAIHTHLDICNSCKNNKDFVNCFSVLDKGGSDFELQILEALHIMDKKPNLNTQLVNNGSSFALNIF